MTDGLRNGEKGIPGRGSMQTWSHVWLCEILEVLMALWLDCEDLGKSQLKSRLSNWIGVQSNLFN